MLTTVAGGDHLLRGNLEGGLEFLGGGQYHPEAAYICGLTPTIRYNFATGSRWMPFVDGGAGVTATDIGKPDLSTTFQFNSQIGAGCHYFIMDDMVFTFHYRFMHVSNAGIEKPNCGVNDNLFYLGISRFF